MTQFTIVTGIAGAGKTRRLLDGYLAATRSARTAQRPGQALWLAPTRRVQRAIQQQLVREGGACFAPQVLTFDLFAEKVLRAAGQPASPMSPVMKRLLLRRIAAQLNGEGELRHFKPIVETTGFFDVVTSFISELKREEIWPETFIAACRQRSSSLTRRDLELGLIYDRYQQQLATQQWYDNEGRFWLARNELAQNNARAPFADVRFLAVDGFVDFMQTQYEILGHLATWIDDIVVSLPIEHPVSREGLFAKSQAAIGRLREHLPGGVQVEQFAAPRANVPAGVSLSASANAIRVIAEQMFSNPRTTQPSDDASGLEIVEAIGPNAEWQAMASRIKSMLAGTSATAPAPVPPRDIVIGIRSIAEEGPLLRDYLQSAGLPVWCEAELPMSSSSIVKVISSLWKLELEDWSFDRLMAVLDSNFFHPAWPELAEGRSIRAIASLLRRLVLSASREPILKVVGRLAAGESPADATNSLQTPARLALPLLARLSRTLEPMRRSHSLADWVNVLSAIFDDQGLAKPPGVVTEPLAMTETRELDLLLRILRDAAQTDQKLAEDVRPRTLNLAEFVAEFQDLLSHETLNPAAESDGCIRILGVEQIRNLEIPHLFLAGLTEDSFPKGHADDCLFSETERREFVDQGVRLRSRSSQHADEMSLFYSVVTRARHSLTLSFPAVNAKGQPVFASPYVTALRRLFTEDAVKSREEGQLDPVPTGDRILTQSDVRLAATSNAVAGRPELFRAAMELEPLRQASWNTIAACEVADHRFHQRGYTSYEGRLELPQNLDSLRHRFGSQHQFSATELEAYARCPFQFWLSNVLKIADIESPEEATDYAARGTLLHDVMADLLKDGSLQMPDQIAARFRELVDGQLALRFPETSLQKSLVQVERLILDEWADAFAGQQTEYADRIVEFLKDSRSLAAEIPFGKLPDSPAADASTNPPIRFGTADQPVLMRGRIDRVDVGQYEGNPAYVVVDYKTGRRPKATEADLVAGRSMQLALYLLAVKRLGLAGPDAVPLQMGYWALQDDGFKPDVGSRGLKPLKADKIDRLEALLDHLLPQLAAEIRAGRFVPENADVNCTGRCAFRTACRVNQLRPLAGLLGKESPPRVDPTEDDADDE